MATGQGVNPGKTAFVAEFLSAHGDARRAAINEAWHAAGHEDEISGSLISKLRAKHGLTVRQGDAEAIQGLAVQDEDGGTVSSEVEKVESVSAEEQPEVAADDQANDKAPSKSAFVEGVLRREPKANSKAVNQAWLEAGHEGVISAPTFYKVKGRLAVAHEPISPTPTEPESSHVPIAADVQGKAPRTSATTKARNPSGVADEVEAGIDDLMYKLKDSGGMPEVEAALRAARRLLYRNGEK